MKRRVRISKKEIEALRNYNGLDRLPVEAIKLARVRAGLCLYDAARLIRGYQQKGQMSIMVSWARETTIQNI